MRLRPDVARMIGDLAGNPLERLAEEFIAAHSDPKSSDSIARAVALVKDRLSNEKSPVLTVQQAQVFERLALPSFGVIDRSTPVVAESLLVAVHARASDLLRQADSLSVLGDLTDLGTRVDASLEKLEPDVFGELIIETTSGAARDPAVAARLETSADTVRREIPAMRHLEESAKALLRPKPSNGDCSCVVRACNGLGDCRNFCIESWWTCLLIVFAIIVIIILA